MIDRLVPGTQLFFLDDDAILFHEPRQELHAFNTMAAVIWCHFEDGKGRAAVADALVADFGIDGAKAVRHVGGALEAWCGLGLLDASRGPPAGSPPPHRGPPAGMAEFVPPDRNGNFAQTELHRGPSPYGHQPSQAPRANWQDPTR